MRKTYLCSLALLLAGCTIIDRQRPPAVQTLTTNYGEQPHVGRGKEVVLTISASDPDNDELDFTWTAVPLSGGPGGKFRNPRAGTAPLDTLVGIFQDTISVVWQAPASASRYLLRVRITDGRNILTDSLFVDVTQRPPLASAGGDLRFSYVDAGTVKLDGRGSSDPDEDQLSFIWRQISGPGVALTNERTDQPVFRPPAAGDYRFALQVYDGADSSSVSIVVIRVSDRGNG